MNEAVHTIIPAGANPNSKHVPLFQGQSTCGSDMKGNKIMLRILNIGSNISLETGKFLIFAPHNDDEVIGCWFLMQNLAAKAMIRVVIVTQHDGYPAFTEERRKETLTALALIGITDVGYLNIPDGAAFEHEMRLEAMIREEASNVDFVLCPAPNDQTPDHIPIAQAAHRVIGADRLIWYRSTWWTFTLRNADFVATGSLSDKKAALACFKSQQHIALQRGLFCSQVESLLTIGRFQAAEAFIFADEERLAEKPFNSISLRHLPRLLRW